MFTARCVAVSLAFFLLAYCSASLLVAVSWRWLRHRPSLRSSAAFLCLLRAFPVAISVVLTFVFTVPSFLLLEPDSTGEAIGLAPEALGLCCLALFLAGLGRAAMAQARALRAQSAWLRGATVLSPTGDVAVYQTRAGAPVMAVAGVCAPRVLVSQDALALLSESEWRTSLKHELAHIRRHDNFKKLLFQFSPFPWMKDLEQAWAEASEIEADDAAVASRSEALDLAAALIKLSRLCSLGDLPLTCGLAQGSSKLIRLRVERLFAWTDSSRVPATNTLWRYGVPSLLTAVTCAALSYGSLLAQVHELTEWLVR
jgi:hypothetical protein